MVLLAPLKGLSKLDVGASEPETLRVCIAVQPARAMGSECWVHERAIAREVVARAGIVDAAGWGGQRVVVMELGERVDEVEEV